MMLYRSTPLELLDVKSDGSGPMTFTAYASTFGNVDHGGDTIEKGAFKDTLRNPNRDRPLLWQHDAKTPIGIEKSIKEDAKGLLGTWEIVDTQAGLDAYKLLKSGAIRSMSIGYIPKTWEWQREGEVRVLKEIDLLENSVVSIPMNDQARIQSVKYLTGEEIEDIVAATIEGLLKAEWTTAYINDLPDSSFAYVESGDKDSEGKTTPRSKRHFPHHNAQGTIDLAHLRNALARAPQSPFGPKAMPHLRKHASAEGVGDSNSSMTLPVDVSLADHAKMVREALDALGERCKEFLEMLKSGDLDLTDAKRSELQATLETFSSLDVVRQDAEAVLAHRSTTDPQSSQQSALALAIQLRKARLRRQGIDV